MWIVTICLDCVKICSLYIQIASGIYQERCCILSNVFSVSNKIICFWFFGIDLCMLSQPCLPGINPAFLGEWFLWNVVGVDSIDWGFWHLFLQGYWSIVTFLCCVFFWFSNWGDVGLKKKSLGGIPPFQLFLNSLRKIGVISSSIVWLISVLRSSGPSYCFRRMFIPDSTHVLWST